MTISFELPHDIEQLIRTNGADLNGKAREAFLVELYREDTITHGQLSRALGLDSDDTDGCSRSTVPIWKSPSSNFGPKLRHSEM